MKSRVVGIALCFGLAVLMQSCGDKGAPQEKRIEAAKEAAGQISLQTPVCDAHKAPKSMCFLCDASLRDQKRLWCNEHDRYEDRCFLCHPEAQDRSRLFCSEHSLYEDECFICHPEIIKGQI